MNSTPPTFTEWPPGSAVEPGSNHIEFLRSLPGPVWINLEGRDRSRRRAIVTLLHGNEPSGVKAIHKLLKAGIQPATDVGIFIASVGAATQDPVFSHRFLPGERDQNRCFNPPFETSQGQLANALMAKLRDFAPEAVIDAHNTSAHSESFAVVTDETPRTRQLVSHFTRRMVVMDIALGTLIEQELDSGPIVTVEFGGVMDPRADALAETTLERFMTTQHLFDNEPDTLTLLRHPHRLEIDDAAQLHYAASVQDAADITIFNTIDQLNFQTVRRGTAIGWPGRDGIRALVVESADGFDILGDYIAIEDGFIVVTQDVTIFMATTDPFIARKDCLLYMTPVG